MFFHVTTAHQKKQKGYFMKKILVVALFISSLSAFADDCLKQASKAASAIEKISQSTFLRDISSSAKLIRSVRSGGEFLNTYEVETVNMKNDGVSVYRVELYSGVCSVIKKVELVSQD